MCQLSFVMCVCERERERERVCVSECVCVRVCVCMCTFLLKQSMLAQMCCTVTNVTDYFVWVRPRFSINYKLTIYFGGIVIGEKDNQISSLAHPSKWTDICVR